MEGYWCVLIEKVAPKKSEKGYILMNQGIREGGV